MLIGVLTRLWKKSLKPFSAGGGGVREELVRDDVLREWIVCECEEVEACES